MSDIMDKFVQGVDYGATVVTEKTRATYGEARVRISMESLRGEREDALIAIGERVMQMYADGEPLEKELFGLCTRVSELNEQLAYMTGKIDGIRRQAEDKIKKKKDNHDD